MSLRIGIDLGGTKIEIIAIERDGTELIRERVSTPKGSYDKTIQTIKELVDSVEKKLERKGSVGIGIPGAISPATGLIKNANSTWLNGKAFDKDLAIAMNRQIKIANDADCFALSEATDGAGKGAATVWGIILGTGAGSGIVINGKLLSGPNAIAGEWGHNPLPWATQDELSIPDCYCGRSICIESFVSGTGLERDYNLETGENLTGIEITSKAKAGNPAAKTVLGRYEDRLGRATASVLNIIDPDVVVLGGGMSNYTPLYEALPKLWQKYCFSDSICTKIKPSMYGDSSGVRGAAWLWSKKT
ncbi:MAG: ROK family protein [Alphaproteobacteria bacterium]|nr:ROK family protein [Alphaproteobacteria bacterium]